MKNYTIVSLADANYFDLLNELVNSILQFKESDDVDICILDAGLTDEQKTTLSKKVKQIKKAEWDIEVPGYKIGKKEWLKSQVSRAFLPKYFPGYKKYLWIDCDAWVNDWNSVELYFKACENGKLGRGADYQKNIIGIDLAKAKFKKKEQDIFFKAVEAYTGLVLANEKYRINSENVNLLERQVETDRIRLDRGEVTVSDVAQSESSLAGAKAKLIIAENEVITNKLNFENVIGPLPDLNSLSSDIEISINLPNSLNNALEVSKKNNPDLIISKLEFEQSEKDVEIARSDLSPSASISFEKSYSEDLSATYDEREKDILKATVTWPFYSGGKNRANLNKNKNLKTRKRLLLDSAVKTNEAIVASAWSNFLSNQSLLSSVEAQVRAAEIANEGITAEYESGVGRTTLDVIQSNSLLLNALITRADSERNLILSQFNLLKSMGLLNSDHLKIN